jgi:hypothetical protein
MKGKREIKRKKKMKKERKKKKKIKGKKKKIKGKKKKKIKEKKIIMLISDFKEKIRNLKKNMNIVLDQIIIIIILEEVKITIRIIIMKIDIINRKVPIQKRRQKNTIITLKKY